MSKNSPMPSIHRTLTHTLLLGAGFFIVGVSLLLDLTITGFLTDGFDDDIFFRAQSLVTLTKVFEEGIELDFAGEFMPEFETAEGPEYFEIWLPDGSLLERSESLGKNALPTSNSPVEAAEWENVELPGAGLCRLLRITFHPQQEDADVEGELEASGDATLGVTLLLARKRNSFDQLLKAIHFLIWGSLGVLLLVVIGFVRLTLRRGLRPLDDIQRQVQNIDPGALDSRIFLQKPVVELTPVVDQLNAMLVRLEDGVIRERRFTSDVAHELRTPLSELRSLSEVGLKDPDDHEMVVSFFQDTREISLEMEHLVSTLLELSRCDGGSRIATADDVDLTSILQKVLKRVATHALERQVKVDCHLDQPFVVKSDWTMVETILQNLLNNAVSHGPQGCTVVVEKLKDAPGLKIRNPAPNLVESDLTHLFERFWQKDAARTGGKNAGLGLSLVKAFALLLNLELSVQLEDQQLTFCLVFPGT